MARLLYYYYYFSHICQASAARREHVEMSDSVNISVVWMATVIIFWQIMDGVVVKVEG